MSVSAYILNQLDVGKSAAVSSGVAAIPGVISAEEVTGPYDVIVKVESESLDTLGRNVVSRIQLVEGITRTLTCPVMQL